MIKVVEIIIDGKPAIAIAELETVVGGRGVHQIDTSTIHTKGCIQLFDSDRKPISEIYVPQTALVTVTYIDPTKIKTDPVKEDELAKLRNLKEVK